MSLRDGKAPDLKTVGDTKPWKVLFEESSEKERWSKTTRAMQLKGGCLVQTIIISETVNGVVSLDTSLVYVSGISVQYNSNKNPYLA